MLHKTADESIVQSVYEDVSHLTSLNLSRVPYNFFEMNFFRCVMVIWDEHLEKKTTDIRTIISELFTQLFTIPSSLVHQQRINMTNDHKK